MHNDLNHSQYYHQNDTSAREPEATANYDDNGDSNDDNNNDSPLHCSPVNISLFLICIPIALAIYCFLRFTSIRASATV